MRRDARGMRDLECEPSGLIADAGFRGDATAMCVLKELATAGFAMPEIPQDVSLLERRWARPRACEPVFTASRDGVYPKYHAVGEEGDTTGPRSARRSMKKGFGLGTLLSEPRRRA